MNIPSKSKLWLLVAGTAAILAAVFSSACGDDGKTKPSAEELAPVQELRLNLGNEPETIDPNLAMDGVSIGVIRQLYSGLLSFDQNLSLVPALASEVPSHTNGGISDDGLTYTFKLREDAKWSDGQPITAADIEYSVKRLLDPHDRLSLCSNVLRHSGCRGIHHGDGQPGRPSAGRRSYALSTQRRCRSRSGG